MLFHLLVMGFEKRMKVSGSTILQIFGILFKHQSKQIASETGLEIESLKHFVHPSVVPVLLAE